MFISDSFVFYLFSIINMVFLYRSFLSLASSSLSCKEITRSVLVSISCFRSPSFLPLTFSSLPISENETETPKISNSSSSSSSITCNCEILFGPLLSEVTPSILASSLACSEWKQTRYSFVLKSLSWIALYLLRSSSYLSL